MNFNYENTTFIQRLSKLGFNPEDDCLVLTKTPISQLSSLQIQFHIERANDFGTTAVYLRKQLNGSYKPQVYLYDFTDREFNERNQNELSEIQKKIWSRGEVPLVCIFYNTEIKILNSSTHINYDHSPVHLVTDLKYTGEAHHLYNEQFALKIKSGVFWDEEENKNKFRFKNSAYDKLIENIRFIIDHLRREYKRKITEDLISKIIVQAILIKYLEERIDINENKLLTNKYFKPYDESDSFTDVLKNGKFVELLNDLNDIKTGFNGNVFQWTKEEQQKLREINLSRLAELLETKKTSLKSIQIEIDFPDWRNFEFRYIPVELISRLYEEFLGANKKNKGLYYTPAHLAQLLIDESIPLKKYEEIDPYNFQIMDPACGSGIFLVTAFKRLVQIWRLRNDMKFPEPEELKKILNNIYGVDQEEQAISLASFSLCLALCNELKPLVIINKLKFDDLTEGNLIKSDFFEDHKLKGKKFDLIIGNPPFARGGTVKYRNNYWKIDEDVVNIPNGQIALKFLADSYSNLKNGGLQCLIIKSTSLLYGSSSDEYRKFLFSKTNVVQIFDFTALAEGKSLWDNGARVGAAAIFLKKDLPDFSQNILHLTFRRTKATRERIVFEIDDYDLHFINRDIAIKNKFIWKINLLGGGRIKNILEKLENFKTFKEYLTQSDCIIQEGHGTLKVNVIKPTLIRYRLDSKDGIVNNKIEFNKLKPIPSQERNKVKDLMVYHSPNIIISETINIEEGKIKIALNQKDSVVFKNRYVGVASKSKDIKLLKRIFNNFLRNNYLYILQIFVKSAQAFINRNTAILAYDLYNLSYVDDENNIISIYDLNIAGDVIKYLQEFLRLGEKAKAVMPINKNEFQSFIKHYGQEFSSILNLVYENKKKKFRMSDVVKLRGSFIATVFKYDNNSEETVFHSDNSKLNLKELTDLEISKHLTVNRIVKMYPQKDTIVFVKPNQYRYWLSLIAYRDADKCFSDLSALGY